MDKILVGIRLKCKCLFCRATTVSKDISCQYYVTLKNDNKFFIGK